jgi:hypothetical protein
MTARGFAILMLAATAATAATAACTSSPRLAATAQPIVDLPSNGDFGTVQIGNTAMQSFTIGPASGLQSDTIESIALTNCPAFALTANGLPTSVFTQCDGEGGGQGYGCTGFTTQTYTFQVAFTPTIAAPVSCVVQLTIDQSPRSITLTGTGIAPPVVVGVPAALDFDEVRVANPSAPLQLTVTNAGSQMMTVSSVIVTAGSDVFSIASGAVGMHMVPSNGSDFFGVVCDPTAVGSASGAITVSTNDPTTPLSVVPLTCDGIDSDVDIASPIQLPDTRVGETVTRDDIAITNDGTASLQLLSATISGNGLAITTQPDTIDPIQPGSGTTLGFTWLPSVPTSDVAGLITITSADGKVRTARIHGAALATHLSIDPDGRIDYGPVCIGYAATRTFQVVADEPGGFELTGLVMGLPFVASGSALPAAGQPITIPIAGNGATTLAFTVTATPTDNTRASTTLELTTDIPGAPTHDVSLVVTGLDDGVTTTPSVLNFGTPEVGGTPEPQTVVFTNCTSAPVAIDSATIIDDADGDFQIITQPAGPIPSGGSAVYTVAMAPRENGVKLANLVVVYGDGSASVPLAGTATGGANPPLPSASYYTCATGDGAAVWPIGAALGAMLAGGRRRRRRRA